MDTFFKEFGVFCSKKSLSSQNPTFIIRHFAADVTYNVDGFLTKNKDTVSEQLMIVMKNSKVNKINIINSNSGKQQTKAILNLLI